jgi:acetolactate synthase-1/2/3 large subunit
VDIPKSVQAEQCEYNVKPDVIPDVAYGIGSDINSDVDFDIEFSTEQAITAIKGCKRPYIYAGGGVLAAGAEAELFELSKRLSSPVGFSMMGLTALPADYEQNLGMCGMHGRYAATVAQAECDLMIALGVRFSDRATGDVGAFTQGRVIIHVDIDLAEIGKNVSSNISVCGDVRKVLQAFLREIPAMCNDEWQTRIKELKLAELKQQESQIGDFTPKNIIDIVNRRHSDDSDDGVVATDVGQHQMWTMQYYKFKKPRTLLTSGGLGAMGYGMGAAIGGCVAKNRHRTVLFTSDGSFGMNLNELATAVSQELPLVIVLLNNSALGMVRQWQGMFYEQRYSQTTINRKTDFAALAKAFGAVGRRVESLPELEAALSDLPENLPTVLDCRIDRDEKVFPMIPPGGTVKDIIIRGGERNG